jgi:diguanylate cyclase (GGDEF)-like protein
MGGFSWREGQRLAEQDRWVSHTRDILELSEALRSHLADAAAARRDYLPLKGSKQIDLFNQAVATSLSDFDRLRAATVDNPVQQSRLRDLEPLIQNRIAIWKESIALRQQNSDDRAAQENFTNQSIPLGNQTVDLLREFEAVERDLLQQRSDAAGQSAQRSTRANGFLGLCAFLFLAVACGVVNREITDGKRQRKLLESILNSCSDAMLVADRDGKLLLRNPAANVLYDGVNAGALTEDYPKLMGIYRGDRTTLFSVHDLPLARTIRGESVDGLELYIRRPDHATGRYLMAAGRPMVDENGNRSGGVIVLRDITQHKENSERLGAALEESERNARERAELNKLAELLQTCQNVTEACKVVESLGSTMFGSRPGAIFLTNSSRNLVQAAASWNGCSGSRDVFDPSECWGLRLGKPFVGGDVASPLRCSHVNGSQQSSLCVPLMAQGETCGVLYIEDGEAQPVDSAEAIVKRKDQLQHLAMAVAERISLAVANLTLREVLRNQSIRDPLTGLFNRRYMEESLNREIQRAFRTGRSLSFVMLDLDHFKQFNDHFGHQAGDLLLKEVAATIKGRVRAGDLACRFGGEEFALILCEVDTDGARKCVEHIRSAIKSLSMQFRGQTLGNVTISAGIGTFPIHSDNQDGLVQVADQALYRAKNSGRDCVCDATQTNATVTS